MLSARNLSRVVQGLGGLGLATLAIAVVVAYDAAAFHAPPLVVRLGAGVAGIVLAAALVRALVTARRLLAGDRVLRRRLQDVLPAPVAGRRVLVVEEERLVACCVGWWRPRVVVSSGARETLTDRQLHAVVAHEEAHARRRDPARLLAAAVATEALGFLPGARHLGRRYAELLEVAADHEAVQEVGRPSLAAALVAFSDDAPAASVRPTQGRIDGLLGEPTRIKAPRLLADGAVLASLGLAAAGLTSATGCFDVMGLGGVCGGRDSGSLLAGLMVVSGVGVAIATSPRHGGGGDPPRRRSRLGACA